LQLEGKIRLIPTDDDRVIFAVSDHGIRITDFINKVIGMWLVVCMVWKDMVVLLSGFNFIVGYSPSTTALLNF